MKSYHNDYCLMGYLPWLGEYVPFATEDEYEECYNEYYHNRE